MMSTYIRMGPPVSVSVYAKICAWATNKRGKRRLELCFWGVNVCECVREWMLKSLEFSAKTYTLLQKKWHIVISYV